jgi:hypothetical protein
MIAILSPSKSASSMKCVVKIMMRPSLAFWEYARGKQDIARQSQAHKAPTKVRYVSSPCTTRSKAYIVKGNVAADQSRVACKSEDVCGTNNATARLFGEIRLTKTIQASHQLVGHNR